MSNVSNINIWPVSGHKTIRANGNAVFFGALKVKFTVIEGQNGVFIGYPGRFGKAKDSDEDVWYPDVTVVNEEVRSEIQTALLGEFNSKTSNNLNQDTEKATGQTEDDNISF